MKLLFGDGQTLNVQSITTQNGRMTVNVINNVYEQLKHLFTDPVTTGKIIVENGTGKAEEVHEGYTIFGSITERNGGIFIVEMEQEGKDTNTRIRELETKVEAQKEEMSVLRETMEETGRSYDDAGNLTEQGALALFARAIQVDEKPTEDGVELSSKEGYKWVPKCDVTNGTPRISWELVEDKDYANVNDGTDYTRPIKWKKGALVLAGMWYTDGASVWEAITDGTPEDFSDEMFFDVIKG